MITLVRFAGSFGLAILLSIPLLAQDRRASTGWRRLRLRIVCEFVSRSKRHCEQCSIQFEHQRFAHSRGRFERLRCPYGAFSKCRFLHS
jgi:hypothetical protein